MLLRTTNAYWGLSNIGSDSLALRFNPPSTRSAKPWYNHPKEGTMDDQENKEDKACGNPDCTMTEIMRKSDQAQEAAEYDYEALVLALAEAGVWSGLTLDEVQGCLSEYWEMVAETFSEEKTEVKRHLRLVPSDNLSRQGEQIDASSALPE